MIYDGDCGFCTLSVNWGHKHFKYFPAATPSQGYDFKKHGLTQSQVDSSVWLVDEKNFSGHRAVAWLLRRQPELFWKAAGWLMITPPLSIVFRIGYRLVVLNRHRLPGSTNACKFDPKTGS